MTLPPSKKLRLPKRQMLIAVKENILNSIVAEDAATEEDTIFGHPRLERRLSSPNQPTLMQFISTTSMSPLAIPSRSLCTLPSQY
jgi:hypothetical protein